MPTQDFINPKISTQLFTQNGKYLMLALDHRDSFAKMVNPQNPQSADVKPKAIEIKKQIITALISKVTGILIDEEYGFPAYIELINTIQPKPFLLPTEKSGYTNGAGERLTEIEHSALQLKNMGAAGVKLLVYFNPNVHSAPAQMETAKRVLNDAHAQNMPLFLEIVTYNATSDDVVVKSVEMFLKNDIKPDVFKLEYPKSAGNCKKITEMLGETPWILLTRGETFETFSEQLQIAVNNGCKGFLAGRGLWQEIFKLAETEKDTFLKETLSKRFEIIANIAQNPLV